MPTPTIWYKLEDVADIEINYGSHGGTVTLIGSNWNIVSSPYPGVGNAAGPAASDNYTNVDYQYLTGSQKPWSIAMWYKTPVDSGSEQISQILLYGMGDNYKHITFQYRNGTAYKYFQHPQNGIGYASHSSSVAANAWVFVVATFDGTDFNWYLDGAVDLLGQPGNTGFAVPYCSWFRFRSVFGTPEYGTVGDFKFFEEEISLADVQQLYNEGIGLPPTVTLGDVTLKGVAVD